MSLRQFLGNRALGLLPPTRCYGMKRGLLRWMGVQVGDAARITSSVRVHGQMQLTIGEDAFLGHELLVAGGACRVTIGARVDIGPRVTIVAGTHEVDMDGPRAAGAGGSRDICVGAGAWIGAGCTILAGATIGENAVVAAGSVVTGDLPARSVCAGVPCRPRKTWDSIRGDWNIAPREAA